MPSTWRGSTANASAISWASSSEPEGTIVSTAGRDEEAREYVKNQEEEDKRLEQLDLWP